jgi:DNA-binding Lrp family transcriptional regulator
MSCARTGGWPGCRHPVFWPQESRIRFFGFVRPVKPASLPGAFSKALMDELLKILQSNAREPVADIARMLNVPEQEVKDRMAEFEKKGIIRCYQAILNDEQVDPEKVTAVIEVRVTPQREGGFDTIAQRLSRFPEVRSAYLMSGGYDILLFVEGRSLREVATFVSDKLSTLAGVVSTSTHFMLKTYKRFGVLMHQDTPDERLSITP